MVRSRAVSSNTVSSRTVNRTVGRTGSNTTMSKSGTGETAEL